ncbi:hypothetical protein G6031_05485 [Dietzia sp. CQ4]|uniref:hypothetical protein n=1 Tax=Dietzia sp. (strain CQ4) TaxID=370437 RepID=UPI0015F928CC|nr:hypothetical protein [Dietzia sp. CQ4]MBB1033838.1 hypothetical protein [Dietzia sp. CQ4]
MAATSRKPGRPPRADRRQRTTRIPVHLDDQVHALAAERGIAMGDAIVVLLARALDFEEPGYITRESNPAQRTLQLGA